MSFPPLNKPAELAAGGDKGTAAGAHNTVFAFVRKGDRRGVAARTRKFRSYSNSPVGHL